MIDLTLEKVTVLLHEAVQERGSDYVYRNPDGSSDCLYVHGNPDGPAAPGCIVGWVLHKAGISLEVLEQHEHKPARTVVECLPYDNGIPLRSEDGVTTLLRTVQQWQDRGEPWGSAVSKGIAAQVHPDWQ